MCNRTRYGGLDFLKFVATVLIIFHHYQQGTNVQFKYINFYFGRFYFGWLAEISFIAYVWNSPCGAVRNFIFDFFNLNVSGYGSVMFLFTFFVFGFSIVYYNLIHKSIVKFIETKLVSLQHIF